jgi:hypothetical protein
MRLQNVPDLAERNLISCRSIELSQRFYLDGANVDATLFEDIGDGRQFHGITRTRAGTVAFEKGGPTVIRDTSRFIA